MSVRVTLAPLIYGRKCLDVAISSYAGFCSVKVVGNNPKGYEIEIEAAPNIDEAKVTREFLNYLLDVSLEGHLRKL